MLDAFFYWLPGAFTINPTVIRGDACGSRRRRTASVPINAGAFICAREGRLQAHILGPFIPHTDLRANHERWPPIDEIINLLRRRRTTIVGNTSNTTHVLIRNVVNDFQHNQNKNTPFFHFLKEKKQEN